MARLSLRQQADALLQQYGPEIAAAYQKSIDEIRSSVTLKVVVDRLKANDIDGVIAALNLDRAAFAPLETAIATAYQSGGSMMASNMPKLASPNGGGIVFRFDVRNPAAESWLRDHSSRLVTNIIQEQRDTVRSTLVQGLSVGKNPTQTAVEIVGRVNRITGKREGGTIGLTGPQTEYVKSARDELGSADPEKLRNYLARGRRDQRFDRAVTKSLQTGKPIDKATVDQAVQRYSDRLLKLRADTIGLNETFTSLEASKHEMHRQSIESGKFAEHAVTKKWRHFPNEHPRTQHIAIDGQVVGFNQQFTLPDGTRMRFPHDPEAPASQTIGCYCQGDYVIDYFARARAAA